MGAQLGALHSDGGVDISHFVALALDECHNPAQQDKRVDTLELLGGVGKVLADVAKSQCAKQCIADGVHQHIAIGVGNTTLCVGYLHPTEHQSQPFAKGVHIVTVSYSEIHSV